ncbi:hypothetical protein SAMN02745126_05640 [Enhydrobacter aerosaccus]|uniref:Uncharacterized protein n=1 Tax=Enhydrobacter aerosaccus TaxID=225324 RepID=A0A1T4T4P9_9HYPH|nr:hypothetical protein [Enhydrobacter aerosaccus]SKA35128.1 hypothetical protein SAMN02745126_05640 [Enhydrobacter aerosaccus]
MPAAKLLSGEVLSESFGFFFNNLSAFFHLVTVPWILSLLLRVAFDLIASDLLIMVLLEKAADLIPTVMFLVGWMRFVLLGPSRIGNIPGLSWTGRETAFLIHLIKVAGVTFILLAGFTFLAGAIDPAMLGQPLDPELARREALAAPLGAGFIVSALLALRVSFGLAGTAIDIPFNPRQAWAASRGSAWVIIGALFVIFVSSGIATIVAALVPLALVRGALDATMAAAIIAWTVAILVSYAGVAVVGTAQAIIFRRLTGWRDVPAPVA